MNRRRDPGARRQEIIDAACALIPTLGVAGLTHRAVAARAGVPVGSTTYYFATLDDLTTAALEQVTQAWTADLAELAAEIKAADDPVAALVALSLSYHGSERAVVEAELYLAATHRPELRPLADCWRTALVDVLTLRYPPDRSRAAAVFLDGVLLDVLSNATPLEPAAVAAALRDLLGPGERAGSGERAG
ncbi:TetR family transcriptional regulator [Actinokineospora terrae]|uniref:TetR family transcriptional regulator n=1 Tax=Actinokineospora terrae TaxID=155974 RepID=UPI000B8445B6